MLPILRRRCHADSFRASDGRRRFMLRCFATRRRRYMLPPPRVYHTPYYCYAVTDTIDVLPYSAMLPRHCCRLMLMPRFAFDCRHAMPTTLMLSAIRLRVACRTCYAVTMLYAMPLCH